jgi:hypothetical protein
MRACVAPMGLCYMCMHMYRRKCKVSFPLPLLGHAASSLRHCLAPALRASLFAYKWFALQVALIRSVLYQPLQPTRRRGLRGSARPDAVNSRDVFFNLGHGYWTCRTESCPLSQKSASVIVVCTSFVDSPRDHSGTGAQSSERRQGHRPDRTPRRGSQTNHSRTALCHLSPLSRSPSLIISRPYV